MVLKEIRKVNMRMANQGTNTPTKPLKKNVDVFFDSIFRFFNEWVM